MAGSLLAGRVVGDVSAKALLLTEAEVLASREVVSEGWMSRAFWEGRLKLYGVNASRPSAIGSSQATFKWTWDTENFDSLRAERWIVEGDVNIQNGWLTLKTGWFSDTQAKVVSKEKVPALGTWKYRFGMDASGSTAKLPLIEVDDLGTSLVFRAVGKEAMLGKDVYDVKVNVSEGRLKVEVKGLDDASYRTVIEGPYTSASLTTIIEVSLEREEREDRYT